MGVVIAVEVAFGMVQAVVVVVFVVVVVVVVVIVVVVVVVAAAAAAAAGGGGVVVVVVVVVVAAVAVDVELSLRYLCSLKTTTSIYFRHKASRCTQCTLSKSGRISIESTDAGFFPLC